MSPPIDRYRYVVVPHRCAAAKDISAPILDSAPILRHLATWQPSYGRKSKTNTSHEQIFKTTNPVVFLKTRRWLRSPWRKSPDWLTSRHVPLNLPFWCFDKVEQSCVCSFLCYFSFVLTTCMEQSVCLKLYFPNPPSHSQTAMDLFWWCIRYRKTRSFSQSALYRLGCFDSDSFSIAFAPRTMFNVNFNPLWVFQLVLWHWLHFERPF